MKKTIFRLSPNAWPLLIGVSTFFLVIGPRALNPANLSWLVQGDPATHYLGWLFFRHSDWTFPIGLNPNYGLEFSNSIIYSDSNPLFALLFKLVSPWLPETFQYFGIWLLLCFVLQAWFAWKLLLLATNSTLLRALGIGFFLFSPPMIFRLSGHMSLVGHFFIIAALYMAVCPRLKRRKFAWGMLLAFSALAHAYLLAMVFVIWCADTCGRVLNRTLPINKAKIEALVILMVIGLTCWQTGYFSVQDGISAHGYGFYRMNLASLFDSGNWSYALRDIADAPGDYEGFNFMGLGFILLFLFALPVLLSGRTNALDTIYRYRMLGAAIAALTLFAITNKAGLGLLQLEIPVPDKLIKMASIFRASGRMFWPVFYVLLFATLCMIIRGYEKRVATFLLTISLFVQIADTHAGWAGLRERLMVKPSADWNTVLVDPFWREAAAKYGKVRWIYPTNIGPHWQTIATYAGKHGLATDAVYLARVDASSMNQAQHKAMKSLQTGQYDTDSVYVLDDSVIEQALQNINRETDVLARVDGLAVLAPGWRQCTKCTAVLSEINPSTIALGEPVLFNRVSRLGYLREGWSTAEEWGTWSDGKTGLIILPLSTTNVSSLQIEAIAMVNSTHPKQNISLAINGTPSGNIVITSNTQQKFEVDIPSGVIDTSVDRKQLVLEFRFPDAVTPSELGIGNDSRQLAVGLIAITVY